MRPLAANRQPSVRIGWVLFAVVLAAIRPGTAWAGAQGAAGIGQARVAVEQLATPSAAAPPFKEHSLARNGTLQQPSGVTPASAVSVQPVVQAPKGPTSQPGPLVGAMSNKDDELAIRSMSGADGRERLEVRPLEPLVRYRVALTLENERHRRAARDAGLGLLPTGRSEALVSPFVFERLRSRGVPIRLLGGTTTYYAVRNQAAPPEALVVDDVSGLPAAPEEQGLAGMPAEPGTDSTGVITLSTGTQNYPIADLDYFWVGQRRDEAPAGATTTGVDYRLRIHNDANPGDFWCSDYEIFLSSEASGGGVPHLLVYDNLGGELDGGYDDDVENDSDIYLNWRSTTHFNGETPNQFWFVYVRDTQAADQGYLQYAEFRIHWTAPDPDLQVPQYQVPAATVTEGAATWVKGRVYNAGAGSAGASHVELYLSTDNDWDTADDFYVGELAVGALAPGGEQWVQWDFTMPDLGALTYDVWVVMVADSRNEVVESNESNNVWKSTGVAFTAQDVPANLVMVAASVQATSVTEGSPFWVRGQVGNVGPGSAGSSHIRLYLSTDNDWDIADDFYVGEQAVGALAAGASQWVQWDFTMPDLGAEPYGVWLLYVVDSRAQVLETDENNTFKSSGVMFTVIGLPDLRVTHVGIPGSPVTEGNAIVIAATVANTGTAAAGGSHARLYLSTDNDFDPADDYYVGEQAVVALAPAASVAVRWDFAMPDIGTGTYDVWALFIVDSRSEVTESDENNRFKSASSFTACDSLPAAFTKLTPPNETVGVPTNPTLTWQASTGAASYAYCYDTTNDDACTAWTSVPGTSVSLSGLAAGTTHYWHVAATNPSGTTYSNGSATAFWSFTTAAPAAANLRVTAIKAPAAVASGASFTLTDTTRNDGPGAAGASHTARWLSTNKTLGGDTLLGTRAVPGLAAGAQSVGAMPVTLPALPPGVYYLLAQADAHGEVAETNEADNVKVKTLLVGPDLLALMVFAPPVPTSTAPTTITVTTKNNGGELAPASVTRLYRSTNATIGADDTLLAQWGLPALPAKTTRVNAVTVTLPAGTYYLIAQVDATDAVVEAKETNNLKKAKKTVP